MYTRTGPQNLPNALVLNKKKLIPLGTDETLVPLVMASNEMSAFAVSLLAQLSTKHYYLLNTWTETL